MNEKSLDPKWVLIGGVAVLAVLFDALGDVTKSMGAPSIPIWLGALGAVGWVLSGPVGKAIYRAFDQGGGSAEVEELRARVTELESYVVRMPELEERVDFAERMLSKVQEGKERLPG